MHRLMVAALGVALCGCPTGDDDDAGRGRGGGGGVPYADLVVLGAVYTADADGTRAEAVAVTDGEIVWVGDAAGGEARIGSDTAVIDADGGSVLPGFIDGHVHPIEAGSTLMGDCLLDPWASAASLIPVLQACAEGDTKTGWVLGWGHSIYALWDEPRMPKDVMDEAIPDVPAAMMEETSHSVWANSAALAAAAIDADTPQPAGGVIVKDAATGEPTGLLLESAGDLVLEIPLAASTINDQVNYEGLLWSLEQLASHGITSVGDARAFVDRNYPAIWARAEVEGALTARANLALWADARHDDATQLAAFAPMRDDDGLLRVTQVKLYADGITSHGTAALLEPYVVDLGVAGPTGMNHFDAERLAWWVAELELLGLDAHIHAIGDRGIREALDAVEAARVANPELEGRHRVTHVEYLHPDDVPRFAALDVVADIQTTGWWVQPEYMHDEDWLLGADRIDDEFLRLRDLHDAGASVVLSSDWDVSDMNPLLGISHALSRGEQSLPSLEAALRAYTIEPARLLRQEELTGSIEVGKAADLVVLDRDLFAVDADEIAQAQVEATLLEGEVVYAR